MNESRVGVNSGEALQDFTVTKQTREPKILKNYKLAKRELVSRNLWDSEEFFAPDEIRQIYVREIVNFTPKSVFHSGWGLIPFLMRCFERYCKVIMSKLKRLYRGLQNTIFFDPEFGSVKIYGRLKKRLPLNVDEWQEFDYIRRQIYDNNILLKVIKEEDMYTEYIYKKLGKTNSKEWEKSTKRRKDEFMRSLMRDSKKDGVKAYMKREGSTILARTKKRIKRLDNMRDRDERGIRDIYRDK